jgi:hypothetical protein
MQINKKIPDDTLAFLTGKAIWREVSSWLEQPGFTATRSGLEKYVELLRHLLLKEGPPLFCGSSLSLPIKIKKFQMNILKMKIENKIIALHTWSGSEDFQL